MSNVDMNGYVEVKDRIVTFRDKHPDGCLRPVNPEQPYSLEYMRTIVEGKEVELCFIVYTAAAYRSPDDLLPGIGVAWEPFPGRTPYTRNSELMNAETSAWGRAIVAALAADAGPVATTDDVEKRRAEDGTEATPATAAKPQTAPEGMVRKLWAVGKGAGKNHDELIAWLVERFKDENAHPDTLPKAHVSTAIDELKVIEAELKAKGDAIQAEAPKAKPADKPNPDFDAYKALMAIAELKDTKEAVKAALGHPKTPEDAFHAFVAFGQKQREALEVIAKGEAGEEIPF